jgi:hypothetical protein
VRFNEKSNVIEYINPLKIGVERLNVNTWKKKGYEAGNEERAEQDDEAHPAGQKKGCGGYCI